MRISTDRRWQCLYWMASSLRLEISSHCWTPLEWEQDRYPRYCSEAFTARREWREMQSQSEPSQAAQFGSSSTRGTFAFTPASCTYCKWRRLGEEKYCDKYPSLKSKHFHNKEKITLSRHLLPKLVRMTQKNLKNSLSVKLQTRV